MQLEECDKIFAPFAGHHLLVGFSGGADSTVALLACLHARNRFGCPVTAIHFEHGLRGEESRQDAAAARDFAENSDVPFREIPLGLSPGPGLEERARAARLAVWRQLVTEIPEAVVVLGHHADDAVETLFLRLARGANVSGLVGMRPVSRLEGMTILRPLLAFARAEIEAYLRARDIQWRTDSSNQENTFSRNALRNIILPEFRRRIPGSSTGLLHSLEPLRQDAEFLEEAARERFAAIAGKSETTVEFWRTLPQALQIRVLRHHLSELAGREVLPPPAFLARLRDAWLADPAEAVQIPLSGMCTFLVHRGRMHPVNGAPLPGPAIWLWRSNPRLHWGKFQLELHALRSSDAPPTLFEARFDAALLPDELIVDRRRPGDRILPFGRTTELSLKKLRIDRKLPFDYPCPVLREPSGRILWAPGIRHSACAPLSAATTQAVEFRLRRTDGTPLSPEVSA